MNPNISGQVIPLKGAKAIQWEKHNLSNKSGETAVAPYAQKTQPWS